MDKQQLEAIRARDAAEGPFREGHDTWPVLQSVYDRRALLAAYDALRSRLAEAEELRDWWHARAISLFWNPGDETTCAVVRNDAALAMEWIKSRAPDSAPTALTCEHGNMVGGCVACALADSAPGAAPAARYRLQNKCDPYRLVDFDAKRWNLIVVPANQPDGAA